MKKLIVLTGGKRFSSANTLDFKFKDEEIEWMHKEQLDVYRNPFSDCNSNTKIIKIYHVDKVAYMYTVMHFFKKGIYVLLEDKTYKKIKPIIVLMCTPKISLQGMSNPDFSSYFTFKHCKKTINLTTL
jgi:hypothetical protein